MLTIVVDESDEGQGEEGDVRVDEKIFPDFVFTLEATDEFLRRRVMDMPEAEVAGSHNNEQGILSFLSFLISFSFLTYSFYCRVNKATKMV